MYEEPAPEIMEKALKGVRNRFLGKKFSRASRLQSDMKTDVRITVSSSMLRSLAYERGCTTTELISSMIESARASTLRSNLYLKNAPSCSFFNLGELYLPEEIASRVRYVDFRAIRRHGRGSACTAVNFGGRTIINCSRKIREHKFEYFFVEELRAAGLDAVVEPALRQAQGPESGKIAVLAYSAL